MRLLFTKRLPDAVIARAKDIFDLEMREKTLPLKAGRVRAESCSPILECD